MWPFRLSNKWTMKQKAHRRLCRQEEEREYRAMERLINFYETAQELKMTRVATTPYASPNQEQEDPFSQAPEALPSDDVDEFTNNSDPKGDACCYEARCPCHSNQQGE